MVAFDQPISQPTLEGNLERFQDQFKRVVGVKGNESPRFWMIPASQHVRTAMAGRGGPEMAGGIFK